MAASAIRWTLVPDGPDRYVTYQIWSEVTRQTRRS
jgi:hypothetical protein